MRPNLLAGKDATTLRMWIGLGSNLGDRTAMIERALAAIDSHPAMRVRARSSLHETDAVGGPPGQGRYLNAAAEIEVFHPDLKVRPPLRPPFASDDRRASGIAHVAKSVLDWLLEIERSLGRTRDPNERNAPRVIDIDLLLVEGPVDRDRPSEPLLPLLIREPDLELPHPRMHERRFVLAPLAEIAPTLHHPRLGFTIAELLARLTPAPATPR